jgi:hypothetical protein
VAGEPLGRLRMARRGNEIARGSGDEAPGDRRIPPGLAARAGEVESRERQKQQILEQAEHQIEGDDRNQERPQQTGERDLVAARAERQRHEAMLLDDEYAQEGNRDDRQEIEDDAPHIGQPPLSALPERRIASSAEVPMRCAAS